MYSRELLKYTGRLLGFFTLHCLASIGKVKNGLAGCACPRRPELKGPAYNQLFGRVICQGLKRVHMSTAPTLYQRLGEDQGIEAIARSFYALMEQLPEAAHVHSLHQMETDEVRRRLVAYLIRFFDGPDRYREQYGEPMMRRRHMHIPIGPAERDAWMLCMHRALQKNIEDDELRTEVEARIAAFAEHMRNRD